jgi:uncharacterized protein YyaL (SSP411 family)
MPTRCWPVLAGLALACVSEHGPLTNRMSQAATPYLARAAREPVSWQPWGRDAFALAARLDRPVLLYVGAEDCRWCGVMDREVYRDPGLGALIDSLFVPVRVDRDERPDVAQRYGAAVRALAGLSGYPVTVFLTPDGSAFFGGTYFPLDDPLTGRGLRQLLPEIAKSYREQRPAVLDRAALVRDLSLGGGAPAGGLTPAAVGRAVAAVRAALAAAASRPELLATVRATRAAELLLAAYARTGDSSYLGPAHAAVGYLVDSGEAVLARAVRDDPPDLVRAGLLRDLALALAAGTASARYADAARALVRRLAGEVARSAREGEGGMEREVVFADRSAYLIGSVLEAGRAAGDGAAVGRAAAALDTLLRRVYARGRPVRHATGRGGAVSPGPPAPPLLDDQVQVAGACLAAYAATGAPRYREIAEDVAGVLERDFADSSSGGYFEAAVPDGAAPALALRVKPVLDDLLPGGNAWAARMLLELARATGQAAYRRRAAATLAALATAVAGEDIRAATYLTAAQELGVPQ